VTDPGIYTSHVGYLPVADKTAIVDRRHVAGAPFVVRSAQRFVPGGTPVVYRGRTRPHACVWGDFSVADFSELSEAGTYQVVVGEYADTVPIGEQASSFQFAVADDVYVRTMRRAFDYFGHQRCGAAVPGYHPVCHLDDAVMRDSGEHRDTGGGWHDAGDLRKWLQFTQVYIYAMLELHARVGPLWSAHGSPWGDVLDEARWGNDYQLKMLDRETGEVFHDVAGGVHGDNSDCRWTDNVVGTGDERHIARVPEGRLGHQWAFVMDQARMFRVFAELDERYANRCLEHALLALRRTPDLPSGRLHEDALAVLALLHMYRATGNAGYRQRAVAFSRSVCACQAGEWEYDQREVTGYLYADKAHTTFHRSHATPGVVLHAASELAVELESGTDYSALRGFLERFVEGYAEPMARRNPFAIIPWGLYARPLAGAGRAHPLAGGLSYRYFNWREASSPERAALETETFQHGHASCPLSYAVGLLSSERVLQSGRARAIALRQLEWVMGANPLAACLMNGAGANMPLAFSPFVGPIPGGMINGFIGNEGDVPFMHPGNTLDWNTNEYWGTHAANYFWALSLLYEGSGVCV